MHGKAEKKARSSRKETNYMGVDATVYDEIDTSITSEFVGYDRLVHESKDHGSYHRKRDRRSTFRW